MIEKKLLIVRLEGYQVTLVCLMKHFSFVDCCLISVCLVCRLLNMNGVFRWLRGRTKRACLLEGLRREVKWEMGLEEGKLLSEAILGEELR